MEYLYIFALPDQIDGMTHVAVTEEIRDRNVIKLTGTYGKDLNAGFQPATHMVPFVDRIQGERLIDLDEDSKDLGRPAAKKWWDMDQSDVADWEEQSPAVIQARIDARKPAEE